MDVQQLREKCQQQRFARGTGILGPEYYGCCNSGMRPLIVRCPYRQVDDTLFLVGPELSVGQERHRVALDHLVGKRQFAYGTGNTTVYVFKTKANAIEKFLELCSVVLDYNAKERLEVERLAKKAMGGDIAAALELGIDH